MKTNHEHTPQEIENNQNNLGRFCSAISNLVSWAKGNSELQSWPKFSLDALVSCFKGINENIKKDNFLTEKPLAAKLQLIFEEGNIRRVIPEGTRITLVVNPCLDEGLQIPSKYLDDDANKVFPYFKLLYSNPEDPHGNALGLGNIKPAPFLHLYPEEILNQCAFVVNYSKTGDFTNSTQNGHPSTSDDNDSDYLYLAKEMSKCYQRLQELVKGRLV